MKLNVKIYGLYAIAALVFLVSCQIKTTPIVITPDDYYLTTDKVTEIMIHDIFSPPVASRILSYPNVAAYEIIAVYNTKYNSLSGQLRELTPIPTFDSVNGALNPQLAALIAHMEVSKGLIFSEDKLIELRDSLYNVWEKTNKSEFKIAREYGLEVAEHIKSWMNKDNYKQTRSMPKYTVYSDDPSRWQPTPPAYMDAVEPHWAKIRPFVIDSASQFKPTPPLVFSLDKKSDFYKELIEVYSIGNLTIEKGDASNEIKIAQFWDCNPYVSVSSGHLMFATKKITPGAHWMGIVKIAARKTNSNFDDTIFACTKTSLAIADAFISCWDEKYRSNLIRPETLINQYIDENWKPILQTPPFPEYPSGHSVVSGAAATALTDIFGDNFRFDDDTEIPYGLPVRSFNSFNEAAEEAAISRMYGGIHFRTAIEVGVRQGRNLGKFVNEKLKMKK